MITIYKYELKEGPFGMPKGSEILTIQMQNGLPYIWALVDTDAELDFTCLVVIGTGQEMPEKFNYKYISTFQNGQFVWHVFEINKKL